jgi:hypothetical protein
MAEELTTEQIKHRMIAYKDLFGGPLMATPKEINSCKTKKQLKALLDNHFGHLSSLHSDAESHLSKFQTNMGL